MATPVSSGPVGVLITGGTLDKIHDTATESLVLDGESRVADIFDQGRTKISRFENLMQIDSLDMTDAHRAKDFKSRSRPRPKTVSSSRMVRERWS